MNASRPRAQLLTDRGVLGAERPFSLTLHAASGVLARYIEQYWIVRWDLPAPHVQETLPHPSIHWVLGTAGPGLHGVPTRRFSIELSGRGCVVGAKFRPGAFYPFYGHPVSELTDRVLPIDAVFEGARALEAEIMPLDDDAARIECLEAYLRPRARPTDEAIDLTIAAARLARDERALLTVEALAERVGSSPRTLQRLFRKCVGVSPKWVLRRYRMLEIAERVRSGAHTDWAGVAAELGYFDQAHFIKDFKAQIGRTPAEYAAQWAAR